ncbi:MAG: hypothetical protein ACI8ZN_001855 [Bacteroidia bacterium]
MVFMQPLRSAAKRLSCFGTPPIGDHERSE